MKIAHLEASPGWGGQEIRTLNESIGMQERGHEVIMIVERNGGLVSKAREKGFKVYEVNFDKKYWFLTFFCIIKILVSHRIEVINTHSSNDSWLGGIVARLLKISIIRTRHLSTRIKEGWNSRFLYGKLADFVVTTCKEIVEVICKQANKSKERCFSVPTGLDILKLTIEEKEINKFRLSNKVSENDILIGTACFMRSWKGIIDFLEAADILRNEKRIKWVIIGGGHAQAYIDHAKKLNLSENVFFTGHLENPYNAIGSLDIFVLLSTAHEGVSQASLQAAYLSKPLITTRTGGLKEVCLNGQTGINVENFSAKEVAEAVIKLKNDKNLRDKYGSRAKKHVEENFTQQIMLDKMESIYKNLKQ